MGCVIEIVGFTLTLVFITRVHYNKTGRFVSPRTNLPLFHFNFNDSIRRVFCIHTVERVDITIIILDTKLVPDFVREVY